MSLPFRAPPHPPASCDHTTVFAEVVALPPKAPDSSRLGARFQLSEEVPLRIGRSSRCRVPVDTHAGHDLLVGLRDGVPKVWADRFGAIACSLSGRTLDLDISYELVDGDHLVFPTGLVLALRERPLVVARHPGLESTLAERPDDAEALAVFSDFLKEHGDPLADWLTNEDRRVESEQFKVLGPLCASAHSQALQVTFSDAGLVTSARLARHAIVGAPGLFWHLEQLGTLAVMRTLTSLGLDYVVGTAAKHVLAPLGVHDWPKEPGTALVMEAVLEVLGRSGFAGTLQQLSFGVGAASVSVSEAALTRAKQRLPRWSDAPLVEYPQSATLEQLAVPDGVLVYPSRMGGTVRLGSDTWLGSSTQCQVIVRGQHVPAVLCRIVRRDEGWVLTEDQTAATMRVNGKLVTSRLVLRVGDLLEPMPGLVLRFQVTLIDASRR